MNNPILQEVKDRLNIADIIAGYIPIKKAGVNFKALCPFHHEKTPSLQISPQKQIWHCFGCGEGGDAFGFVMKYENIDFKEALKLLADKAGVKLPEYRPADPKEQSERELLLRINDFAARFYHEILIKNQLGAAALEYLKNRGLTEGTINQWQIGFAPEDFHVLERALAQKKVSAQDLVLAGVSAKNERGQIYDRFRGRITFPIFDYFGNAVGFSARILIDDGKSAKYVNSPETSVYSKSKILFGLNFAKETIRKQDEAVVVEGQMDCISLHQGGFKNVVASSGTALTE
jgi:DNA primase